jgi:hypothetical protein
MAVERGPERPPEQPAESLVYSLNLEFTSHR